MGAQPIVLVGGGSTRFGRDKLREPVGGGLLIDRPITALREVFGNVVALVGACHESLAARADAVIEDRYPGAGPAGGILSALEMTGGDVFVLAGDLARIDAATVRAVLSASEEDPRAWAVLARAGKIEPCIGVYRVPMITVLGARLGAGLRSLHDAAPADHRRTVDVDARAVINANTPDDLGSA